MGIISEMLSYPFMVRALIGGLLVSLCASLLGVSLVLKLLLNDWRRFIPCFVRIPFDRTGGRLVTFKGFDSGGCAGGIFPAADHGTWKSKE